jgi:hypothetical protein
MLRFSQKIRISVFFLAPIFQDIRHYTVRCCRFCFPTFHIRIKVFASCRALVDVGQVPPASAGGRYFSDSGLIVAPLFVQPLFLLQEWCAFLLAASSAVAERGRTETRTAREKEFNNRRIRTTFALKILAPIGILKRVTLIEMLKWPILSLQQNLFYI